MENKGNKVAFILYYAAPLIPWYPGWKSGAGPSGIGSAVHRLTTTSFIKVLEMYSNPDEPALHRALLFLYKNITTNMNAPKITKIGSQIWRFRSADHWAAMNHPDVPEIAQPAGENGGGEFNHEELAASISIVNSLDTAVNTGSEPTYMKAMSEYYEGASERIFATLSAIYLSSVGYSTTRNMPNLYPKPSTWRSYQSTDWQSGVLDNIGKEREVLRFESSTLVLESNDGHGSGDGTTRSPSVAEDRPLKQPQQEAVNLFCDNFLAGCQSLLPVTGSPGTVNSFTAETAEENLHSNGLGCLGISSCGLL